MWVWVDFRGRPPWNNWASSFLRGNNSMSSWILPCYWCWFWCWWFLTIHSLCMCQIDEAPDSVCSVNINGWACSPSSMLDIVKRRWQQNMYLSRCSRCCALTSRKKKQPYRHQSYTAFPPSYHAATTSTAPQATVIANHLHEMSLQSQTHPCSYHHRFTITPAADGW